MSFQLVLALCIFVGAIAITFRALRCAALVSVLLKQSAHHDSPCCTKLIEQIVRIPERAQCFHSTGRISAAASHKLKVVVVGLRH